MPQASPGPTALTCAGGGVNQSGRMARVGMGKFLDGIRDAAAGLFGGSSGDSAGRRPEAELDAQVERVVKGTEPRLRMVSGYLRKLRAPVGTTLDYCEQLVSMLPAPVELSGSAWRTDPALNAFFASVDRMRQVFSASPELRAFFASPAGAHAEVGYALLSMDRSEKNVLGSKLVGDMVRKDVRQVVVTFSDHLIVRPAESEDALREELADRAFEVILTQSLEQLAGHQARRDDLQEQQRMMEMKLRVLERQAKGLDSLVGDGESHAAEIRELKAKLDQNREALGEAVAGMQTLDDYLAQVAGVFSEPDAHLRLELCTFHLDSMNRKLEGRDTEKGTEVTFTEGVASNGLRRVIMPVSFHRADLLPQEDLLAKAERSLR